MTSLLNMLMTALLTFGVSHQEKVPPVKVDLYYEFLCPYCHDFFLHQLYPTYKELKDVMEVSLYPFGNAEYKASDDGGYTFTCQHGPTECEGNMIHACAQKYITDFDIEMDFVFCLLNSTDPPTAAKKCADAVGIDYAPIDTCAHSTQGQNALHDVALKQEKLKPTLYFVPWILVDDTFSEEQVDDCQKDMMKVVCDKYSGPSPKACETQSRN